MLLHCHSGLVVSLKYDLVLLGMYFGLFSSIHDSSSSFETFFLQFFKQMFLLQLRMLCWYVLLFVQWTILKWKMVSTFLTREFLNLFFYSLTRTGSKMKTQKEQQQIGWSNHNKNRRRRWKYSVWCSAHVQCLTITTNKQQQSGQKEANKMLLRLPTETNNVSNETYNTTIDRKMKS